MSKAIGGVVGGITNTLFGGSSGPQTTTVSPNIPQNVLDMQKTIFDRAQQAAYGKPGFFGFGGTPGLQARQFADFSPLQNQGFSFLSGINNNAGIQGAQNALAGLQGMGFGADRIDPMMVSGTGYNATLANAGTLGNAAMMNAAGINRGGIRDVAAQNFLQGNIGAYQNPYTEAVINQSLADIDRARIMQQQGVNAQALSRGAFGGSRQAIAEAENNRNFLDQQARTSAQLRNQGFDTAAGLMQADMNRALQAGLANQGVDLNVLQQNAGFQQQAGLANQQAANQFALSRYGQEADISRFNAANQTAASQFGADAAMRAALANQAAGLTAGTQNANNQLQAQQLRSNALQSALTGGLNLNQSFLGNVAAQMEAGGMQQALEQQRMDAIRNLPLEQIGLLSDVFSGNQLNYGSTQTSPATKPNIIGGIAGLALGAGGLGWKPFA